MKNLIVEKIRAHNTVIFICPNCMKEQDKDKAIIFKYTCNRPGCDHLKMTEKKDKGTHNVETLE